jgi:hypothetical protein
MPVTELQLASIKADLSQYLHKGNALPLTSPELSAVVSDLNAFASSVLDEGLETALLEIPNVPEGLSEKPFLEVAEVIVNHHLRLVRELDRDILRKSLLEAYIQIAGPRSVFKPSLQTGLVKSLRRNGPRDFVGLFLSYHVFNVVNLAIQDEIRTKVHDIESYESYMLAVETVCRDAVKRALENQTTDINEYWVDAVTKGIQVELLRMRPMRSPPHPIGSGNNK